MKHVILLIIAMVSLTIFTATSQPQGRYYGHYHYYHPRRVVIVPRICVPPPHFNPYYSYPRPYVYVPAPRINVYVEKRVVTQQEQNPENASQIKAYAPMDNNNFSLAMSSINAQPSDDSRLTVARQVADGNYLSSDQVKQIMTLFYTDGTKLAFAEYAYDNVVDKSNFFVVNDTFSSEKTVETLSKYLSGK